MDFYEKQELKNYISENIIFTGDMKDRVYISDIKTEILQAGFSKISTIFLRKILETELDITVTNSSNRLLFEFYTLKRDYKTKKVILRFSENQMENLQSLSERLGKEHKKNMTITGCIRYLIENALKDDASYLKQKLEEGQEKQDFIKEILGHFYEPTCKDLDAPHKVCMVVLANKVRMFDKKGRISAKQLRAILKDLGHTVIRSNGKYFLLSFREKQIFGFK